MRLGYVLLVGVPLGMVINMAVLKPSQNSWITQSPMPGTYRYMMKGKNYYPTLAIINKWDKKGHDQELYLNKVIIDIISISYMAFQEQISENPHVEHCSQVHHFPSSPSFSKQAASLYDIINNSSAARTPLNHHSDRGCSPFEVKVEHVANLPQTMRLLACDVASSESCSSNL